MYPLQFDAPSLTNGAAAYLNDPAVRLLADFFQAKGSAALAEEDRQETWYQDWVEYQGRHGLYAGLLSPRKYSARGNRLDLRRLTRFLEVFAYFSPAHGYSLHVSFLGLFPILLGANEPLKREAIARLESGGLFALGVSEQAHGADLLANEFTLRPTESGTLLAAGTKYYIGNANAAEIVLVLGRKVNPRAPSAGRRAPFAFVALRPRQTPAFAALRKIRTLGIRSAFVGEFHVRDHPVPPADVVCEGRAAWDAVLGTIDFGKFFLGFGAIGICERAFAGALTHVRRRILYGRPVADMPHIRSATVHAYARLLAMKLYACRALDYLVAAGPDDRRYLLFNAVQKARVSTEGVKVIGLLSDCIGAWGFEVGTSFEAALRDAPMIPVLEGSTHINFALAAQFIDGYFADPAGGPPPPPACTLADEGPGENSYWMGDRDRQPRTVQFPPYLDAYQDLQHVLNVRLFVKQVETLREFASARGHFPGPDPAAAIALGRCFTAAVYGQLVAEACATARLSLHEVSVVFHGLVEDFTAEALQLAAMFPAGSGKRRTLRRAVRIPSATSAEIDAIFADLKPRFAP